LPTLTKQLNPLIIRDLPRNKQEVLNLYFNTLKIKDYIEEDFARLDKYLIVLSKFIGLQEPPDDDVRVLILQFLKDNFNDFSKLEIEKAVSLALSFRMKVNDISHYNKLTPQWIASILNSYKTLRGQEVTNYHKLLDEYTPPKKLLKDSPDELKQHIIETFERRKNGEEIEDFGNLIYKFLNYHNVITYTKEEKPIIIKEAKEYLTKYSINKKSFKIDFNTILNRTAKTMLVIKYFDSLIKNKQSISKELLFLKNDSMRDNNS